ncbi:hypothetical protein ACGFNV_03515 [Streptomyces sp. NPDC048751]|uniref:hypothetical protein n=1 Tax=Streptomyces sp. NPDC048751 TaxID=3365591 RepID=UPI0037201719
MCDHDSTGDRTQVQKIGWEPLSGQPDRPLGRSGKWSPRLGGVLVRYALRQLIGEDAFHAVERAFLGRHHDNSATLVRRPGLW